jgi:hypothetical protein
MAVASNRFANYTVTKKTERPTRFLFSHLGEANALLNLATPAAGLAPGNSLLVFVFQTSRITRKLYFISPPPLCPYFSFMGVNHKTLRRSADLQQHPP